MKELLLTPGPTMIPVEVNQALVQSNIHHRTSTFEALFSDTLDRYGALVNSQTRPIALAGTGTAAMDATLQNICQPGDSILILEAGKFGERWIEIAESLQLQVQVLHAEWGETFSLDEVKAQLTHNTYKVICCQYCETSTTALHDVHAIGAVIAAQSPDSLFIVDGITAVGVKAVDQQASNIDVLICGSQKALMLPPGLALLSLSDRAWDSIETRAPQTYYFNLLRERIAHANNTTAFTPAINLIAGLNAALRRMEQEGFDQIYARHHEMSQQTRSGLKAFGFTLMAETCPAPGVTGGFPPQGVSGDILRKDILERSAVRLAGGQGSLKGTIVRFGHMGACTLADVQTGLHAIEKSLHVLNG